MSISCLPALVTLTIATMFSAQERPLPEGALDAENRREEPRLSRPFSTASKICGNLCHLRMPITHVRGLASQKPCKWLLYRLPSPPGIGARYWCPGPCLAMSLNAGRCHSILAWLNARRFVPAFPIRQFYCVFAAPVAQSDHATTLPLPRGGGMR